MFIAHKRESDGEEQSVKEHVEKTANRAREFASQFSCTGFNGGAQVYFCRQVCAFSSK